MSSSFLMRSETHGIGRLITQYGSFGVPAHQRDFAWSKDDVQQFLNDIIGSLENSAEDYFMGLIVLVSPGKDGIWQILDGQQRLATTTMVYAAIRQWLSSTDLSEDQSKLQTEFIGIRELGEKVHKPRLTLNVTNRDAFRDLVVNKCTDDLLHDKLRISGKFSSNRKLIEAAITCRERIFELAQTSGDELEKQASQLFKLANFLRDRVLVVCLEVPSTGNAYMIFESLNDRGVDLSIMDLLKNYIFGRLPDSLEEVQLNWSRMMTQLGDRQGDDFLKAFWTSRYGRIQRGRLFDNLNRRYNNPSSVMKLSQDLSIISEQYSALERSDHDIWTRYSKESRERLRILSLLGSKQSHPILLSAIDKFSENDFEKLLGHLIVATVRYQLIGRGRTGALEIASARIASEIFSEALSSPMKVWKELSKLVPNDDEFRSDFEDFSESSAPRAKYLLKELELTMRRDKLGPKHELEPLDDLTIEHIFPKNPSQDWRKVMNSDKDIRNYTNRMGNLCLVNAEINRRQGSSGFEDKRNNIYSKSPLVLTSYIAGEFDQWDRRSIETRQRMLAELAVRTWPLPQD